MGLVWRRKAVDPVTALCEFALPVENLDTCHNLWWTVRKTWWSVRGSAEGVFALERRVGATLIAPRPGHTAQRRQSDRSRQHNFTKPAFHVRLLGWIMSLRVERLGLRTTRTGNPLPAMILLFFRGRGYAAAGHFGAEDLI